MKVTKEVRLANARLEWLQSLLLTTVEAEMVKQGPPDLQISSDIHADFQLVEIKIPWFFFPLF